MNADGSGQTPLTTQPYASHPAWSPDNHEIAYAADGDADGWLEVWRMGADGTGQHQAWAKTPNVDYLPSGFTPDGENVGATAVRWVYYQGQWYVESARMMMNGSLALTNSYADMAPSWGSLDLHPPIITAHPLPAVVSYTFTVKWDAVDVGPAGLRDVGLEMRIGPSGEWTKPFYHAQTREFTYQGKGGQTYYFRFTAIDRHFNVQPWPVDYSVATTVESLPPVVHIETPNGFWRTTEHFDWSGYDPGGSGIASLLAQYRQRPNGAWQDKLLGAWDSIGAPAGHAYDFRLRATDRAGNVGAWPPPPTAVYTIYRTDISGQVIDARHIALPGAAIDIQPAAMIPAATNGSGEYLAYLPSTGVYSLTASKTGYDSPLATVQDVGDDSAVRLLTLWPQNNLVVNGGFDAGSGVLAEGGAINGWAVTGAVTLTQAGESAFLGNSLRLETRTPLMMSAGEAISSTGGGETALVVGPDDHVHWLFRVPGAPAEIYHQLRSPQGEWSDPELVASGAQRPSAALMPDGALHVVWSDGVMVLHRIRSAAGEWGAPAEVNAGILPAVAADAQGRLHLAYYDFATEHITYRQRSAVGVWQSPLGVRPSPPPESIPAEIVMHTSPEGALAIVASLALTHECIATAETSGQPWSCRGNYVSLFWRTSFRAPQRLVCRPGGYSLRC